MRLSRFARGERAAHTLDSGQRQAEQRDGRAAIGHRGGRGDEGDARGEACAVQLEGSRRVIKAGDLRNAVSEDVGRLRVSRRRDYAEVERAFAQKVGGLSAEGGRRGAERS